MLDIIVIYFVDASYLRSRRRSLYMYLRYRCLCHIILIIFKQYSGIGISSGLPFLHTPPGTIPTDENSGKATHNSSTNVSRLIVGLNQGIIMSSPNIKGKRMKAKDLHEPKLATSCPPNRLHRDH